MDQQLVSTTAVGPSGLLQLVSQLKEQCSSSAEAEKLRLRRGGRGRGGTRKGPRERSGEPSARTSGGEEEAGDGGGEEEGAEGDGGREGEGAVGDGGKEEPREDQL